MRRIWHPHRGHVAGAITPRQLQRVAPIRLHAITGLHGHQGGRHDLGLFEHPYVDPNDAATWNGHADHRALARDAARESIVLLRNERRALPLAKTLRSVAVIGADAVEARLGGYSGPGVEKITILDGIKQKLAPSTRISYLPGPGRLTHEFVTVPAESLRAASAFESRPGLTGEYFDNNRLEGAPRMTRVDARMDFRWTLNSPGRGWVVEPGAFRILVGSSSKDIRLRGELIVR
jgi:hypothetical protein